MARVLVDLVHDLRPPVLGHPDSLRKILGNNPVVGHNVGFDLGFLREARVGIGNQRIDTLILASILILVGLYLQRRAYKPLVDAVDEVTPSENTSEDGATAA